MKKAILIMFVLLLLTAPVILAERDNGDDWMRAYCYAGCEANSVWCHIDCLDAGQGEASPGCEANCEAALQGCKRGCDSYIGHFMVAIAGWWPNIH